MAKVAGDFVYYQNDLQFEKEEKKLSKWQKTEMHINNG